MIKIRSITRIEGEADVLRLVLTADPRGDQESEPRQEVELKRSDNIALFDFITTYAAAIPTRDPD
jgi:hypothetical protein